jgi:hypothetical protein
MIGRLYFQLADADGRQQWVEGGQSPALRPPRAAGGSAPVLRAWNLTTYQRPFAVVSFLFLALSTRVRPVAAMAGLIMFSE